MFSCSYKESYSEDEGSPDAIEYIWPGISLALQTDSFPRSRFIHVNSPFLLVCSGIPQVSQGLQHFLSKMLCGEGIKPEEREIATGYADTFFLLSR